MMHMILAAVNNEAEQDGTVVTYPALHMEARTGKYHSAWHNGDVSYARGAEWQVRMGGGDGRVGAGEVDPAKPAPVQGHFAPCTTTGACRR